MAVRVVLLTLTLLWSLQAGKVSGYYCDSDRCGEDEYCCGFNICCSSYKVWELWYFWFGIIIFMILLSSCACFWKYRHSGHYVIISPETPYTTLTNNTISVQTPPNSSDAFITNNPGNGNFYTRVLTSYPPAYTAQYSERPGEAFSHEHSNTLDSYYHRKTAAAQ